MSLYNYTIKQVESMLKKKEISAEELTDTALTQIKAVDQDVKAFLTVTEEAAKQRAKEIDSKQSYDGKLSAIPAAIKDNIVTNGLCA